MTLVNEDMNKILEYLTSNDQEFASVNPSSDKMDAFGSDNVLSDSWPTESEDLLENIFSLEESSFKFLEESMPDFNLCDDVPSSTQPSDAHSSSCSDSGLSSDHAELDFEQQLSPFLIQNSCDDDVTGPASDDVIIADMNDAAEGPTEVVEEFDMEDFENNVVPGFINNTFQSPSKAGRKRRLSQTPQAIVQPKVQRPAQKVTVTNQKPQLIVRAQPHKPVKVTNIQVIPTPKVFCKPMETVAPQRKVIRVAPMAGNPRSILLPVTIKDMKDLKSIKIINAADLKNASNIKLAAANLLSQSKLQDLTAERLEYEYEHQGSNNEESGSEHSDDDDEESRKLSAPPAPGRGYPRLLLSAEERRLLAKEGISLPASYPLTKHEERELKRIRRKIRNKISAQDSRKRKKEYVDGLEDRVKQCSMENQTLIRRIKILQTQNQSLSAQLKRLQKVLTGVSPLGAPGKSAPPATCLLVLLLSVALVALPSLREEPPPPGQEAAAAAAATAAPPHSLRRALLSATQKMALDETVIDDGEFNMEELITFRRAAPAAAAAAARRDHDHDYQAGARGAPGGRGGGALPGGYQDIPIDEDWPPNLKKRMKTVEFDYEDGRDYIPPIIKNEKYENYHGLDTKMDIYDDIGPGAAMGAGNMGAGKMGVLDVRVPVKSEDIVLEQVDDYDSRNITGIKSFVVNGTASFI